MGTAPFTLGADNTSEPFRARCSLQDGIAGGIYPFMHKKTAQAALTYHSTTSPLPLQQAGDLNSGGCDCSDSLSYSGTPPAGTNWQNAYSYFTEGWQGAAQNLLTIQSFASGATENLGVCHDYGYKNVLGYEQWYGMYSFTSTDSCQTPSRSASPDTTRYRTLTVTFSYTTTTAITASITNPTGQPAATGTVSVNGKVAITVDTYSGIITLNQITPFSTSGTNCGGFTGAHGKWVYTGSSQLSFSPAINSINGLPIGGLASANVLQFLSTLFSQFSANVMCGGWNNSGTIENMEWLVQNIFGIYSPTLSGGSTTTNATATTSSSDTRYGYGETASGSQTASITGTDFNMASTMTSNFVVSATIGGVYDQIGTISASLSLDMALSNSNTAGSIRTDIENNLLSLWLLSDHALYPWRHDPWTGIMPCVTRRQVPHNVTPNIDFVNASAGLFWNGPLITATAVTSGSNLQVTVSGAGLPTFVAGQSILLLCSETALATWSAQTIASVSGSVLTINGITTADLIATVTYVGLTGTTSFDGAIIGGPHPNGAGGYGWFDFYFNDFRMCLTPDITTTCAGDPPYQLYGYAKGGTLADTDVSLSNASFLDSGQFSNFLPQCATHWTNNSQAHFIPRGAMIDIGGVGNVGIDAPINIVKWAECRLPVPSYNFFRPCGSDRVLIDEPTAQHVSAENSPGVSVYLSTAFAPSLSGQLVLIAGTPASDGIYSGCTMSGTLLNLGTKVAPLPTGYSHLWVNQPALATNYLIQAGYGVGIAGIVRFPNAWALCGRQALTFASDGLSGTVVSFAAAQVYLRTADAVDFWDAAYVSAVQSNVTIQRFDVRKSSHSYNAGDCIFDGVNGQLCTTAGTSAGTAPTFSAILGHTTVDGGTLTWTCIKLAPNQDKDFHTTQSASSLGASVWATSHGAPGYYWNDTAQKFDLRYQSWTVNNRPSSPVTTAGGAQSDCLPISPCYPQVICFSPNGETWPQITIGTDPSGTATVETGHNYWFGSSGLQDMTYDGIYGYRVQANVEFEIPDLLYQPPYCPPTLYGAYTSSIFQCFEDNGTCQADQYVTSPFQIYFPPHPRMEALATPPTSANGAGPTRGEAAPSLPTDAVNGLITWPAMNQPQNQGVLQYSFNNVMLWTPGAPWLEAWTRYSNELTTYADGVISGIPCRWLAFYTSQTLGGGK